MNIIKYRVLIEPNKIDKIKDIWGYYICNQVNGRLSTKVREEMYWKIVKVVKKEVYDEKNSLYYD